MISQCGRYILAFNGEIYNHKALRALLHKEMPEHSWNSLSDTETLLECFAMWGIERTLKATVGMFAFALWDRQERLLALARDRMGEKPLYWGWQNDVLFFGSELKALKAHPAFTAEISRNALALLVRYNYIPAPYSIYTGIEKLLPGHYVNIRLGQTRNCVDPQPYWSLSATSKAAMIFPFTGSDMQAIDALDHELTASVRGQMLADVPLGAFLSGGIDSSIIVALMQKQSDRPVRTFTIGFDEAEYNEGEHAKAVARHLNTDHSELYVNAQDALAVVPKLPEFYCEPFADSSAIPAFLVSRLARQSVTAALSGDGGDELFGGYTPYQFAPRVWSRVAGMPLAVRGVIAHALSYLPLTDKLEKLMVVLPASSRDDFFFRLRSHWQRPESVVLHAKEPVSLLGSPEEWGFIESFEQRMMAVDARGYMVDDILVKVDRAAMANSLETRVPMLDHRIVELAWRLPLDMKIRDGKGKWILRELLARYIPRELFERPKKGFMIPLASWLRGPLRDWAEALLDEGRLQREGYFNAAIVRKAWLAHLKGRRDLSPKLWSILMFQAWLSEQ